MSQPSNKSRLHSLWCSVYSRQHAGNKPVCLARLILDRIGSLETGLRDLVGDPVPSGSSRRGQHSGGEVGALVSQLDTNMGDGAPRGSEAGYA